MKITRISVFQVDLPLHEGSYKWSGGKSVEVFDSTVVRIETDAGVQGHGEVCPLGPFYLPSYARGVRAGLEELAPQLIGEDPTQIERLNRTMDRALKGHPYVKSAIDIAAWDVLGQVPRGCRCASCSAGATGTTSFSTAPSRRIPRRRWPRASRATASKGYRRFQLKVGGDPDIDIERIRAAAAVLEGGDKLIADANTGWLRHEAMRVAAAVRDVDVYIEQPCASYEECLSVRRHTDRPFVLDESIDGIDSLLRGHADLAMDVVNIKIGKFGGLSRARQARDLCLTLGIAMTIEDTWGGDIVTAAIAHLAHSTPPEHLFTATDFNSYVTVSIAADAPQRVRGRMAAPAAPGLGVTPRPEVLGESVLVFE